MHLTMTKYVDSNMKNLLSLILICSTLSVFAQREINEAYGDNVITLSPLTLYGSDYLNDIGIGIEYERFSNYFMSIVGNTTIGLQNELLQAAVGVKFYPSGHDKPVSYGLSPMLMYSMRSNNERYYSGVVTPTVRTEEVNYSQFGLMIMNSMNATLNEHLVFGVEGGLGVNYFTSINRDSGGREEGPSVSAMFKFRFGYRF